MWKDATRLDFRFILGNDMRKGFLTMWQILVGVTICLGLILVAIYPHRPSGVIGWAVLTLVAVPIVLGLEFIGASALQNGIVARMGKLARIVFGVVVILLISILILLAWKWVAPYFGTW